MQREPRRRAASSAAAKRPQAAERGLGRRVGLQKRAQPAAQTQHPAQQAAKPTARPAPPPAARKAAPRPAGGGPGPAPQPAAGHRVTKAERLRQRRRRAIIGFLLVLMVSVIGIFLSVNLLFKANDFRIENLDGTQPADTGIYTEEQILDLLGVQPGANLLGFSTAEKTTLLAGQLPYLDEVQVNIRLPGTVVVKVHPATERFALQLRNGWLVLSDRLRILRSSDEAPEGVILLDAPVPDDVATLPGQTVSLLSNNTLTDESEAAQPSAEDTAAEDTLAELMAGLEEQGLLEGLTALSLADLSELSFTYQGRVEVHLGTANGLADKLYIAARALLDVNGQGLGASDRGTLEFYQNTEGKPRAYFHPYDPNETDETTPPEQTDGDTTPPEGETNEEGGEGGTGEESAPPAGTDSDADDGSVVG